MTQNVPTEMTDIQVLSPPPIAFPDIVKKMKNLPVYLQQQNQWLATKINH